MSAENLPAKPEGWEFVFASAPLDYEWLTLEVKSPGAKFEIFRLSREQGLGELKIEIFEAPMPELSPDEFERGLAYARSIYSTGLREGR